MKTIAGVYQKTIKAGHVIEVYTYERLNVNGGGAREKTGINTEQNYKNTQRARRNRVRQLVLCNFNERDKFVTFTFGGKTDFDVTDVNSCNKYWMNFIKRLRRRYKNFKYIAVVEFQDKNGRGAVHYHMISNLPYIKKSELAEIWGAGFVYINAIDKVDNIGAYVTKYMNKDLDDERLQGLKAYNHSRGLLEPVELKTWDEGTQSSLREINALISNKKPSYSAKYESPEAGTITYTQYNLLRE